MPITEHSQLNDPAKCSRLVVKVGSSLLVDPDGRARMDFVGDLARDISAMRNRRQDVVVVSSGAIALGAVRLGLAGGGRRTLAEAQAAAAVGQIALASAWSAALASEDIIAAQVLLSLDDFEDRARYLNACATLAQLIDAGAVPIVNENDSVATEEIRFGDNDRLAARVAQAVGAQAVILLSDVDGLYDADPVSPAAQRVERVEGVTPAILAMAQDSGDAGVGTGGMLAKLRAAEIAERSGIALVIAPGSVGDPILAATQAGGGTLFVPQSDADARRSWIGARQRVAGSVTVDRGCADALAGGGSVLAAGIQAVSGAFSRGDLIEVMSPDDVIIARGLSEYDLAECQAIIGCRNAEQAAILGYAPRSAVIHRNQMVLL